MSSGPVETSLVERPPASVEDYNDIGRDVPEERVAAVEAAASIGLLLRTDDHPERDRRARADLRARRLK